jgi:hypothetical protein
VSPDHAYHRARLKVRCRPTWLLRRQERRIIARHRPDALQLAELAAIRGELRVRSVRPRRWWRCS